MRESEIRDAIRRRTLARSEPVLVVPELALSQAEARIDVAVIGATSLVGWEIKARTDRLDRLPRQEAVYSRIFDRMWLAADPKHLTQAMGVVPEWWGIMRVEPDRDGNCRLVKVRDSRINRSVDLASLVRLLWRDEVLAELQALGLANGESRQPKRELWDQLANAVPGHLSATALRRLVRQRLMARQDWRVGEPRN